MRTAFLHITVNFRSDYKGSRLAFVQEWSTRSGNYSRDHLDA